MQFSFPGSLSNNEMGNGKQELTLPRLGYLGLVLMGRDMDGGRGTATGEFSIL